MVSEYGQSMVGLRGGLARGFSVCSQNPKPVGFRTESEYGQSDGNIAALWREIYNESRRVLSKTPHMTAITHGASREAKVVWGLTRSLIASHPHTRTTSSPTPLLAIGIGD